MDIHKFNELLATRGDEYQHAEEWKSFLEFTSSYFGSRGISNPLVVEIGIYRGASRIFYEQLLNAKYIGIDIDPVTNPDIVGNSNDEATVKILIDKLGNRNIDLLFIDGDHNYEMVKRDYDLYSPLVGHIIVLHDTTRRRDGRDFIQVYRLWQELQETENTILFKGPGWEPQGTGLILKKNIT